MSGKAIKEEKPTPLGDRVFTKHRKMLKSIARKRKLGQGEAVRFAIEDTYERRVKGAAV